MKCIYCGSALSVSNSRLQKKANNVWRRRNCGDCGAVFTTTEQIDLSKSLIYKSKTGFRPFSEAKLLGSIKETFRHRGNPHEDARSLTDTVIARVIDQIKGPQVTRHQIISTTLTALNRFDKVASAQYGALHPL